jgi:recombination protein RecA
VTLADGTSEKIGKIVNQRMSVEVLSYDPVSGKIEPRRIVNWFDNGPTDAFIQFEVEGGPSGRRCFAVTENHIVFTPNGEVPAGELEVGDEVLVSVGDYTLTDDQLQLLMGGGLGDGSIRMAGAHTATFRVAHGPEQIEYMEWKHSMLRPFSHALGKMGNGTGFDTVAMPAVADLRAHLYDSEGGRIATATLLDRLDARGLAVWYGDDGSFMGSFEKWGNGKAVLYNKSLSEEAREAVMEALERFGVGRPRDDGRGFWFNSEQTARLHALIAPYLHPSLSYKIHPSQRGKFIWEAPTAGTSPIVEDLDERRERRAVAARVTKKYVKPETRGMHRFDIEVEGNHTYLVDGVVVHNSPETTAGGRALKFYASIRMDIRRIATLKEGERAIGNRTKVKVVKNKVAAPFREAEFDILYNEGISREGELIDMAIDKNVVQKAGTWFSFGEERIGQGRENARLFLKEHADIRAQVEAKLLPMLGLTPTAPEAPAAAPPASPPKPGLSSTAAKPQPAMVATANKR